MPLKSDEEDYQVPVPKEIKKLLNDIGRLIGSQMPKGWGFTLLMYTYDAGTMSYISNGAREDMIRAMREFIFMQTGNPKDKQEFNFGKKN